MSEVETQTKVAIGATSPDTKQNGHPPSDQPNGTTQTPAQKRPPRPKKPNYAHIHRNPLPLQVHPLPAFHPTNPLSLLQVAYAFLSTLFFPPSSHPEQLYTGFFDPQSRSVHVTDPAHIRALWEMGFFGKGTLSRSEPSWLDREKARREILSGKTGGGGTAEEATRKRREERRAFKLERARLEAERVRRQRDVEEGRITAEELRVEADSEVEKVKIEDLAKEGETVERRAEANVVAESRVPDGELIRAGSLKPEILVTRDKNTDTTPSDLVHSEASPHAAAEEAIEPQEFLQLTLEEAFFLSFGLGVLNILQPSSTQPLPLKDLLPLFARHSTFPPLSPSHSLSSDPGNAFLLSYAVYHHFRSLGWVVRPGTKFGCDWLLYNRGPVFSHAEFAVVILPAYSDPYWSSGEGRKARKEKKGREENSWWWLHCVTRVQSQVKKSAVLVYVEVPPPTGRDRGEERTVSELLGKYKVREFVLRRWLMNRSRG